MLESFIGSILEDICPVELAKYWKNHYWASSTGRVFYSIDPVEDFVVADSLRNTLFLVVYINPIFLSIPLLGD